MTIEFPNLSNRFDAEDIRKLREYNSLRHSKMSHKEILDDIRKGAESFLSEFNSYHFVDVNKMTSGN
jgi:hypothetical protein